MSKNFDETVRLQSKKEEEWIQEIEERDYKGLQRALEALLDWQARSPGETSVWGLIVV